MGQLDTRGFFPDNSPNPALSNIANTLNENRRYKEEKDYRRAKDQEGEDWRKLNLIQDLTDLSKHQTSSDVANAVGNQKAAELLQKYTAGAKTMSPAELQAKISQDMSGLIGGMDAMKNELDLSDAQLKALKTQFPSLDAARLAQEHRADILHRRMDSNMNFINPMAVPQSEMDLNNIDFLSNYITGNKNLSEAIINPKGVEDQSVLMGNADSHTTFTAKQPFWKTPNFKPEDLKQGYYNGKEIPQLKIKGSELPSDAMPSSNGKPFKLIDKDVYDRFANDSGLNLELTAATKKAYPTYDKFSPTEKEYAKRNILYNQIETLDQTNFHPTGGTKPARISVNTGGGTKGETTINNVYDEILTESNNPQRPHKSIPITELSETAGGVVLKIAREREGNDITQADIFVKQDDDGVLRIYHKNGAIIAPLTKKGTNLKVQPSVKEKREVIKQGETKPKTEDFRKKYNY